MKHKVIDILRTAGGFVSGEKISQEFGISRTAIWKYINSLRNDGYEIESATNKGYRLISSPDKIDEEEVIGGLETEIIGKKILHFNSLGSTNDMAKEMAAGLEEGSVIVAEEQTTGKGRLGRSWSSPGRKGIYMSVILKPDGEPSHAAKLTLLGAAAVASALEEFGIDARIKWPNDIILNTKKVAGILTEMSSELGIINYVVLGIGINVNQAIEDIPEDIVYKATSLRIENSTITSRQNLFAAVLSKLDELYIPFKDRGDMDRALEICREKSAVIGKDIIVVQGRNERPGHAISINNDGELMVKFQSGVEHVISGEVSIRTERGYV